MRFSRSLLILAVLCWTLSAWTVAVAEQPTLMVHSGAALRPALDELGKLFTQRTGVKVDYNYKGSGCLLPDVVMSHQGDVYIPGEEYFMKQACERKLVETNYKLVATMTAVIIVQAGNPKHIMGLADLGRPGVRLGMGDPKVVAVGRAGKEALIKAKVWDKAEKNLAMSGQNVSELSIAVKLKKIDAAIVWDATAAQCNPREVQAVPIPEKYAVRSVVPAGIVAYTRNAKEAKQYVDFLSSPEGTRVFLKHGFTAPPKARRK